jgi:TIR domain/Tetratricopeptide repeat
MTLPPVVSRLQQRAVLGDRCRDTGDVVGHRTDFFVSHAGADRAWAEWVAWQLNDAGYTVELDIWDWAAGQNFMTAMSDALGRCDRIVALFSAAYFDRSRYTAEEWSAAALHMPGTGDNRLVPVRVAEVPAADVPAVLQPLVFRDLFGVSEEQARQILLEAVEGPRRPDRKPVFPAQGTPRPAEAGPRLPGSLPRIWNVQQRNPAFVGRDTALVEMRDQLLAGGTAVARALNGMAGVGKTQLAVEYAYRFSGTYELVWWIAAERAELIAAQLADLAVQTGVAVDTAEIPGAVGALYSDLRHRNGWLLIFDNAEDPLTFQQWLPSGPGHVLITSRNPNWGEIAAQVNVAVFDAAESVTLLRRRVRGISVAAAEHIAAELGNFPLALAQAASVLSETGLPAAVYLEHLASRASETLAEGTPAFYSRSLAATVSDAADRLGGTDPAAAALLRLSASFGPETIPTSFFTAAAKLPVLLAPVAADPVRLHRALGRISSYGLARLDQDGMQVHRLVQAIVRDRLSAEQRREDSDCVAALLVAAGPVDTDNPAVWPAWADLLPHLLAANPAESDRADLRLLATRALLYLLRRGDSVTAENLSKTLYQRWAERLGPDHVDTLAAATELAYAYRDRGHPIDTRALVEDTLARRRRVLGDDHPDTLRSASDLAVALDGIGELQAARELAEDTLGRRRRVLGENHSHTLNTASNLSGVLNALGELQAARELAEDTLAKQRQVIGDNHPHTLVTAANLSGVLNALGELQTARELAEDTLAKQRQVLGDNHPHTLSTARNLGVVMFNSGNRFGARKLLEETLAASKVTLGINHPQTRNTAQALAGVIAALGGRGGRPGHGKPKPRGKGKK